MVAAEGVVGLVDTNRRSSYNIPVGHRKALSERDTKMPWYASHYNELKQGLTFIDLRDLITSILHLFGETAFPIALNSKDYVTIAGSIFGEGRVIVMPRLEFVERYDTDGTGVKEFIQNSINWLNGGEVPQKVGTHNEIDATGYEGNTITNVDPVTLSEKEKIKVFKVDAHEDFSQKKIDTILEWIKKGGGLLIGGQAWSFEKGDKALHFPGNKILRHVGIIIGDNDCDPMAYNFANMPITETNVLNALKSDSEFAVQTIINNLNILLNDETFDKAGFSDLVEPVIDRFNKSNNKAREYSTLAQSALPVMLNENIKIPSSEDCDEFPYKPPESPEIIENKTLTIIGDYDGYPEEFQSAEPLNDLLISTGLYNVPGLLPFLPFQAMSFTKFRYTT